MEWFERHRGSIAALFAILVALGAFALLQVPRRPALQVTVGSPPSPPSIKVHVTGSVAAPGVYQLSADARVDDALRAAGGPSASADVASLNLASPLKDGQQLVIPQARPAAPEASTAPGAAPAASTPSSLPSGSVSQPVPATASSAKVNLNTAAQEELEALWGIGPVTAQKILEYRQAHPFTSVEELREARLVNSATFERIKDLLEAR